MAFQCHVYLLTVCIRVQSNLVNSKSLGLEVLFRFINSSKYNNYFQLFSVKHKFWARKSQNVSRRIRTTEYFEKPTFEFSSFYCILPFVADAVEEIQYSMKRERSTELTQSDIHGWFMVQESDLGKTGGL